MKMEATIKEQVQSLFANLQHQYVFDIRYNENFEDKDAMLDFVGDVASCSDNISCRTTLTDRETFEFGLLKNGQDTGITFRGLPNGHEFTSLLLAVLNADGQGKNLPDSNVAGRIAAIGKPVHFTTYISLTCTNCPDVVQALNVMALLNPAISSEMIDGALFQDEVSRLGIQGVPAVFANGELFHVGRGSLGELVDKLEDKFGVEAAPTEVREREYDVVVVGGGPAGVSSAVYSARKGLKVAVVAGRVGGQVTDTVGIENLISVQSTTGGELAGSLRGNLEANGVDVFENRRVEHVSLAAKQKTIAVKGGEVFKAPAVIIATGANWRKLNVENEEQMIGHGVHFCPHCDGPFYKGRRVVVVGGGNSGIEAAIDLAGICSHVAVLEFADACRADNVLTAKLGSMGNTEVFVNAQTTKVLVTDGRVSGIRVKDRITGVERDIEADGIFVQIGLSANSQLFADELPLTPRKEIEVDAFCRTAVPGVYAAGDVTCVPYKQVVVAMGEGAKAALSVFEDRIRLTDVLD